jgi:hypothetical protein
MTLELLDGSDLALDARQVGGRQLYLATILERDSLLRVVLGWRR